MSVDWSDENLTDSDLDTAILRNGNFCRTDFSGSLFRNADLDGANFYGANLSNADLSGANLCNADLAGADLSGANLQGTRLDNAHLASANLAKVNLRFANLNGGFAWDANFIGADLRGLQAEHTFFHAAMFDQVNLAGANLQSSRFDNCSFQNAILRYTNFANTSCLSADFTGSKIYYTNFTGAHMNDIRGGDVLIENHMQTTEHYRHTTFTVEDDNFFGVFGEHVPFLDYYVAFQLTIRSLWSNLTQDQRNVLSQQRRHGQLSPDDSGSNAALSDLYRYQRGHIDTFKDALTTMYLDKDPNFFNYGDSFTVFDIGSGGGTVLFALAEFAAEQNPRLFQRLKYYGYEPNPDMRDLCKDLVNAVWSDPGRLDATNTFALLDTLPQGTAYTSGVVGQRAHPFNRETLLGGAALGVMRGGNNWMDHIGVLSPDKYDGKEHLHLLSSVGALHVLFTLSYVISQKTVTENDILDWAKLIVHVVNMKLHVGVLITTANTNAAGVVDKTPQLVSAIERYGVTVDIDSWVTSVDQQNIDDSGQWVTNRRVNNVRMHYLHITS